MTIRRTSDPNICFMSTDAETLWCHGIVEFKVDTRNRRFIVTPILRGNVEAPVIDATEIVQ